MGGGGAPPSGGGGCASANLQIGVNFLKIDIDVLQTLSVDPTFFFFFFFYGFFDGIYTHVYGKTKF